MAESGNKSRRWLKYGCFGILGTAGVLFLVSMAGVGYSWLRINSASPQTQAFTHGAAAATDASSPAPQPGPDNLSGPGRVEFDLELGQFTIQPGDPGEPLQLIARYDTRSFDLDERFEHSANGGWVYRVSFKSRGGSHLGLLRAKMDFMLGAQAPTLRLILPRGMPLALKGTIDTGHTGVELGGLWLTDVDLAFDRGALRLDVEEPLAQPVDRFKLRGSVGALIATSLGNASPAVLDIHQRMGGLDVDLRGAWVRDSDVRIVCRMGGGQVRLPRNVVIEGLGPDLALRRHESEIPQPTLRISVTSRLGDLRVFD